MKIIIFCSLLLLSFLSAGVNVKKLESFKYDESFVALRLFSYLNVREQSIMSEVCKSFRRPLRRRIMPEVVRDYKTFSPDTRITSKRLKEFEIIWKIARYIDQKRQFEEHLRSDDFRPIIIDINAVYLLNLAFHNIHFPALTIDLLKVQRTNLSRSELIRKTFSRPEIYKDCIRYLIKEVYRCKRSDLVDCVCADGHISRRDLKKWEKYDLHIMNEIISKHIGVACLQAIIVILTGLAIGFYVGENEEIVSHLKGFYVIGLVLIFEWLSKNVQEEYENNN